MRIDKITGFALQLFLLYPRKNMTISSRSIPN